MDPTTLKITPVMRPGGLLVQMEGVLDHTLDATKLAGASGGALIIDVDGVKRVSSNGVREWIRALRAATRSYLGIVRAHPAVVSQFNMVNKFAAGGELLSFYAPYVCSGCKSEFELLVDVRQHHAALVAGQAPAARCPKCQAEGIFDDMPDSYFSFVASSPVPAPPPIVDQLLGQGSGGRASLRIEKEIQGTITALRLVGKLDRDSPLKRMADGLEGKVLLTMDAVSDFTPEGVERLAPILGSEGISFLLVRVPLALAVALVPHRPRLGAALLVSLQVRLVCARCQASNYLEVDAEQLDPGQGLSRESVVCEACNTLVPVAIEPAAIESLRQLPHGPLPSEITSFLTRKRDATLVGEAAPQVLPSPASSSNLGRYQLLQRIGTGGMAEVYLARQSGAAGFSRPVVLKRILPQLAADKSFVEMFLQEARLASRIAHPNVVQIFDLGEAEGQYFIAMEHVRGWDLNTLVHRAREVGQPFPVEVAAYIAACICAGLHAAHSCSDENTGEPTPIVHRDVSPHNVLVSMDGHVKLADFGVAKAVNSDRTPTTGIKGKLAYMAPEQLSQGPAPLDGRLDIFPAGVVLFQLLTLQHPFQAETEFLTLKALLEGPIPRPSALRSEVPRELDEIVGRALVRDVEGRYQTAAEMKAALDHFIGTRRPTGAADLAAWISGLVRADATGEYRLELPPGVTLNLKGRT